MACRVCACNDGMSNTGVGCDIIFKDTRGLIGVPLYANDGTRNYIDLLTVNFNQAYVDALVNQADASKRWFPIPNNDGLKDVAQTRGDSVFKTFTDGSKQFVRKGIKNFVGFITGLLASPVLVGKLEQLKCVSGGFGFYKIDRDGNLIGSISDDGTKLYPIKIDAESFEALFMEPGPEDVAMIRTQFDFAQTELDQALKMIACSEMNGVNLLLLRGLIDVCVTISNLSIQGFRATLTTEFGTALDPTKDQGLVAADFAIENVTTASSIGFTGVGGSFEEVEPGVYDFVFDTGDEPIVGDELRLTPSKAGRDYTCVEDTVISPT